MWTITHLVFCSLISSDFNKVLNNSAEIILASPYYSKLKE